jgi:predicted secreted protein
MATTARRVRGKDFLVKGTGSSTILGQTSGTINLTCEAIDVTTKSDWPNKAYLDGIFDWTVSLEGAYIVGDDGTAAGSASTESLGPVHNLLAHPAVTVSCTIDGDTYSGSGIVTSASVSGEVSGNVTYSVEIQGNGALTITPASS